MLPDVTGWPEATVEEMLGDLQLWEPVVREIAEREELPCADITAGFPASSGVFLLGDLALKVFTPLRTTDAAVVSLVLRHLASTVVPDNDGKGRYATEDRQIIERREDGTGSIFRFDGRDINGDGLLDVVVGGALLTQPCHSRQLASISFQD